MEEEAPVVPAAPTSTTPFSGTMKGIDKEKSSISFVGKSSIVDHPGTFTEYTTEVTLDETEPANLEKASVTAELSVASVKTDSDGLDGHLQKEEFFDAENYPTVTFTSTSIEKKEGNTYAITGDLSMKGITKSVTIDAEITDEGLTAVYELPRADFGIGKDTYGQKLLDANVPVDINLVFTK
jgi:polyisoprenoid-binding protein YceI